MSRNGKRKKKASASRSYTPITQHTYAGGVLQTKFSKSMKEKGILGRWLDERVPELLWVLLILSKGPRGHALDTLRAVGQRIFSLSHRETLASVFLSDLAAVDTDALVEVFQPVLAQPRYRLALRPMLLFEKLPGRAMWEGILQDSPVPNDWNELASTVGASLSFPSEMATDACWVRLLCFMAGDKLKLPKENVEWILNYPQIGAPEQVRPFIRATDNCLLGLMDPKPFEWSGRFWDQCLKETTCWPLKEKAADAVPEGPTLLQIHTARAELARHFQSTRKTSSLDARHEAVFGIALYSTAILYELFRISIGTGILGRLGLRTIVEGHLTLAYLIKKNQPNLWSSFRAYGSGQAKLAFLKLDDLDSPPDFVSSDLLRSIANEDLWAELVDISTGHWDKTNLRSMSVEADQKATYDSYYSWNSTYAHSHWCAVRDTVFVTCGNPLHRLHRIPRLETRTLEDVVLDACTVVDMILANVLKCYPGTLSGIPLLRPEAPK